MPQHDPHDDLIARVLRDHYETEAADAGLRSIDLSGAGGGRSAVSPDAAMVARVNRQTEHRRVRSTLARLTPEQQDVLASAYGCRLRDKDADAESPRGKRKDQPGDGRPWRVRLRARLPMLGELCALVVLAPSVRRSFDASPRPEGVAEWLASTASRAFLDEAQKEALTMLAAARKAFAKAYEPRRGQPRLDAEPPRRTRRFDKERLRREAEEETAKWLNR